MHLYMYRRLSNGIHTGMSCSKLTNPPKRIWSWNAISNFLQEAVIFFQLEGGGDAKLWFSGNPENFETSTENRIKNLHLQPLSGKQNLGIQCSCPWKMTTSRLNIYKLFWINLGTFSKMGFITSECQPTKQLGKTKMGTGVTFRRGPKRNTQKKFHVEGGNQFWILHIESLMSLSFC